MDVNATGMFDITGTMWLVTLFVLYGIKSAFIPWLWPIFNQVFLMVYLATWLRRSGVMTGAEWIRVRFGSSRGAMFSHISVVIFAIAGMIAGIAAALSFSLLPYLKNLSPLNSFPILLLLSGGVSVWVTLRTKPEDMAVLKQFYKRTHPWGLWGPVVRAIREGGKADFQPNRSLLKDVVNVAVGIVWQLCLCLLPFYLVIRDWKGFWAVAAALTVTSVFLKMNWYNKLGNEVIQPNAVPTDFAASEGC